MGFCTSPQSSSAAGAEPQVLVELAPAALSLLERVGRILLKKIRYEVEVNDFPTDYVENARDEGSEDADDKSPGKCDFSFTDFFAIPTNTKEHHQKRNHHRRITDDHAVVEANPIDERQSGGHH